MSSDLTEYLDQLELNFGARLRLPPISLLAPLARLGEGVGIKLLERARERIRERLLIPKLLKRAPVPPDWTATNLDLDSFLFNYFKWSGLTAPSLFKNDKFTADVLIS